MAQKLLTLKQAAAAIGIKPGELIIEEDRGNIAAHHQEPGGLRLFDPADVAALADFLAAQRASEPDLPGLGRHPADPA